MTDLPAFIRKLSERLEGRNELDGISVRIRDLKRLLEAYEAAERRAVALELEIANLRKRSTTRRRGASPP